MSGSVIFCLSVVTKLQKIWLSFSAGHGRTTRESAKGSRACTVTEHSAASHLSRIAADCDAFVGINQQFLSTVAVHSLVWSGTHPPENRSELLNRFVLFVS